MSAISYIGIVAAAFMIGLCVGSNIVNNAGAIAVAKGELMCKEVEQFSKPAEWQCAEVVSE